MKISTETKLFKAAFSLVKVAVPTRTPKPILQSVLMVADDDGVTLMATNLDLGIRHTFQGADVIRAGSVLLPAEVCGKILSSADEDTLAIDSDDRKLTVKVGKAKWVATTEDPDLFPHPPDFPDDIAFQLAASDAKALADRAGIACDAAATSYALGGLLVERGSGKVRFVATNGRHLATYEVAADFADMSAMVKWVFSVPFVSTTAGLCGKDATLADFAVNQGLSFARIGGTVVAARMVEGRYPNWRDLLTQGFDASVKVGTFEAKAFAGAVDQAGVMLDETTRAIDFRLEDGQITLSASGSESGQSEVIFPIDYSGPMVEASFQPSYLLPGLKVVGDSSLDVTIDPAGKAMVFKRDGFMYVSLGLTRKGA